MLNRSEILKTAWNDHRRDVKMGWGVRRGEAFNRQHFGYCLRMAWAVAKSAAAAKPVAAPVTASKPVAPANLPRVAAIHAELEWMAYGDRSDWTKHSALSADLARLAA
tara:strand:+ start:136 stop:459 length:324 start_codon:yes stop_codon:yes gene_type:complete